MFHFIALSVAVLMLFVARFYSPRHAARAGWAVAFLVPTWLALVVGAADITVRCVVALMAVAVVVVKPRQFAFAGFSWIDLLPVVIVVTAAISTTLNDHFSPTVMGVSLHVGETDPDSRPRRNRFCSVSRNACIDFGSRDDF